jgi:hypothetical protein
LARSYIGINPLIGSFCPLVARKAAEQPLSVKNHPFVTVWASKSLIWLTQDVARRFFSAYSSVRSKQIA